MISPPRPRKAISYLFGLLMKLQFHGMHYNCSVHNVKTLREQRTINVATLHVTLNVMRRGQSKQSKYPCFSTGLMSKLGHFKPRLSNDITKMKDTFYLE